MEKRDEDFIPEGFLKSATDDAKDEKNKGDQRRAELEMKIRHRMACEAKAFDIVNRLIEETVSEEYLQNCCQFIDGSHYADIVEERAITHICGYPLCNKRLEQIPKQKYRISTNSNTVYDLSERKNFCSNQCYKASKHVAKQLPSNPVWNRENDPKRKIHFLDTINNRGAVGEEVIGTHMLTVREELRALERLDQLHINDTSSANEDASSVASKALENSPQKFSTQKQQGKSKTEYLMHLMSSKKNLFSTMADVQFAKGIANQTVISDDQAQTISTVLKEDESQISNPGSEQHEGSASQKTDEKTVDSKDKDSKPFCTVRSKASHKSATSILNNVYDVICHWITEETLHLLGFSGREDPTSDVMLGHMHGDPDIQQNHKNLCQRLAGQEKDFEEFLGEEGVSERDEADSLKPIPSFEKLQKKSQEYHLKVREFYGSSQLLKIQRKSDEGDNFESKEAGMRPVQLPAVDSYNQMLIRRRIVLEKLDRVMPTLLPPLDLAIQDVSSLLHEMIFTFSFTNENIIFQPAEWNLVGIVLLKMLARKYSVVASSFEKSAHKMTFDLFLTKLGHSLESFDKLVTEMLLFCHRHFQQNVS